MGFKDIENSSGPIIFEARWMGFMQGRMAAVEAMNLPNTSPFKAPTQVLLCDDPPIQAQIRGRPAARGEEEEEGGEDSLSMRKLVEQINSYIVVVDLVNPTFPIALEDTDTSKIALASTAPSSGGAFLVLPDAA